MSKQENALKVKGYIYKILDEVKFKSGYVKREFVLETRSEGKDGIVYKNLTKFEAIKSFIGMLDNFGEGSEVVVTFDLAGREWTPPEKDRKPIIINVLRAWKIDVIENTNQDIKYTEQLVEKISTQDFKDDGLPF